MCSINKRVAILKKDIRVFKAVRAVNGELVSAYNPCIRSQSRIIAGRGILKTYRPHRLLRTRGVGMCSYVQPSKLIYTLLHFRDWYLLDCTLKRGWKVRYGLDDAIASFSLLVGEAYPLVYKYGDWSIEASTNAEPKRLNCSGLGESIKVEFGKHLTTTVLCPLVGLRWTDGILRTRKWVVE